ncbi:hypothetical protein KUTeg_015490 [Tegillarca granosa]|uniref:YqaJ viral recombinase domain-containing protein n=1 Tax=Tegillarca granosa TaxID=220873 RepID=A0ABQ9ETX7_TEGGR|nr:hypothetical protein KUTeg_015490 [Tegillarca granosa]
MTDLSLTASTTIEDLLTYKRSEKIPDIGELKFGWISEKNKLPSLSHSEVQNYLINSSHRSEDKEKMECYRQFIREYNFFNEKFLHKMMVNNISERSEYCYVRSKCHPSLKIGTYKNISSSCTQEINDDVACTSKPCVWNQPSKRNREAMPIEQIRFKRIRYGMEESQPLRNNKNIECHTPVETSEIIKFISDEYINLKDTISSKNLDEAQFLDFVSNVPSDILNEVEIRTRGQSNNDLCHMARHGRITSSSLHDVCIRKETSSSANLIKKFLVSDNHDMEVAPLKWGRKYENVAGKKYIAIRKLKFKEKLNVIESGLRLCKNIGYFGASPDGIASSVTEDYLIEIKCPFKWRFKTVFQAAESKDFCCFIDSHNNLQLKQSHRYYSQIQGQMGVCNYNKCVLIIFTIKDIQYITINFDKSFWEQMSSKLRYFHGHATVIFTHDFEMHIN